MRLPLPEGVFPLSCNQPRPPSRPPSTVTPVLLWYFAREQPPLPKVFNPHPLRLLLPRLDASHGSMAVGGMAEGASTSGATVASGAETEGARGEGPGPRLAEVRSLSVGWRPAGTPLGAASEEARREWLAESLKFSEGLKLPGGAKRDARKGALRSLRHFSRIGSRKARCSFSMHVHGATGLPPDLEGRGLEVQWRRKGMAVGTHVCTAYQGLACIDQLLHLTCTLFFAVAQGQGQDGGAPVRCQPKPSSVVVRLVGDSGTPPVVLAEHTLDLATIAPRTVAPGTPPAPGAPSALSFPLQGEGLGGVLLASFGYEVELVPGHVQVAVPDAYSAMHPLPGPSSPGAWVPFQDSASALFSAPDAARSATAEEAEQGPLEFSGEEQIEAEEDPLEGPSGAGGVELKCFPFQFAARDVRRSIASIQEASQPDVREGETAGDQEVDANGTGDTRAVVSADAVGEEESGEQVVSPGVGPGASDFAAWGSWELKPGSRDIFTVPEDAEVDFSEHSGHAIADLGADEEHSGRTLQDQGGGQEQGPEEGQEQGQELQQEREQVQEHEAKEQEVEEETWYEAREMEGGSTEIPVELRGSPERVQNRSAEERMEVAELQNAGPAEVEEEGGAKEVEPLRRRRARGGEARERRGDAEIVDLRAYMTEVQEPEPSSRGAPSWRQSKRAERERRAVAEQAVTEAIMGLTVSDLGVTMSDSGVTVRAGSEDSIASSALERPAEAVSVEGERTAHVRGRGADTSTSIARKKGRYISDPYAILLRGAPTAGLRACDEKPLLPEPTSGMDAPLRNAPTHSPVPQTPEPTSAGGSYSTGGLGSGSGSGSASASASRSGSTSDSRGQAGADRPAGGAQGPSYVTGVPRASTLEVDEAVAVLAEVLAENDAEVAANPHSKQHLLGKGERGSRRPLAELQLERARGQRVGNTGGARKARAAGLRSPEPRGELTVRVAKEVAGEGWGAREVSLLWSLEEEAEEAAHRAEAAREVEAELRRARLAERSQQRAAETREMEEAAARLKKLRLSTKPAARDQRSRLLQLFRDWDSAHGAPTALPVFEDPGSF